MTAFCDNLVGVILCGGRAARMGGANKGLVSFNGRRLYEFACDNLAAITQQITINTNTEANTYKALGFTVFDDGDYLYQGPLAGILAGLNQAETDFVAFASCDQQALPEVVYQQLFCQALKAGAAYAVTDEDVHPTCCVIATRLVPVLKHALDENQLRLKSWMQANASAVKFSGVQFENINQLPQ